MSQASIDPNADYAMWLEQRRAKVSSVRSWLHALFAAFAGGPWAIGTAMMAYAAGLAGEVVFGPMIEEVLKIAIVAGTIERHPYLYRSRVHIGVAAIGGALVFAVIENLIYLLFLHPGASSEIWAWRWMVCTGVHVVCTGIAAIGVMIVWQRSMDRCTRPQLAPAGPWLLAAATLHVAYNAAVTFWDVGQPMG